MATRIHKAIGYGMVITEMQEDYIFEKVFEDTKEGEVGDLIKSSENKNNLFLDNPDAILFNKEKRKENNQYIYEYPQYFGDVVHFCYNDDSGYQARILVVIPPVYFDTWYRSDDSLDYYEEVNFNKDVNFEQTFKFFNKPIYPYSNYMKLDGTKASEEEVFADSLRSDCEVLLLPFIPESVRVIAQHIGIDYLQLRPVYVKWWS